MVERATVRMTMSGFCTWPSTTGHDGCTWDACACDCHEARGGVLDETTYTG